MVLFVVIGLSATLEAHLMRQEPANDSEVEQAEADVTAPDESTSDSNSMSSYSVPDWVKRGSYRDQRGVDFILVTAGPDINLTTVRELMDKALLEETTKYVEDNVEADAMNYIQFDPGDIDTHVVEGKEFLEQSESDGIRLTLYKQLRFDESFREQLTSRWKTQKSQNRLRQMLLIAGSIILSLMIVFTCFQINQATRGFYAGRLQSIAIAAILALVLASIYVSHFL